MFAFSYYIFCSVSNLLLSFLFCIFIAQPILVQVLILLYLQFVLISFISSTRAPGPTCFILIFNVFIEHFSSVIIEFYYFLSQPSLIEIAVRNFVINFLSIGIIFLVSVIIYDGLFLSIEIQFLSVPVYDQYL